MGEFYRRLFVLKKENTALWNAKWGAIMINVPNNVHDSVLSFVRRDDAHKVFAVLNLSGTPRAVTLQETLHHGSYTDFFTGRQVDVGASTQLELDAWAYCVFVS